VGWHLRAGTPGATPRRSMRGDAETLSSPLRRQMICWRHHVGNNKGFWKLLVEHEEVADGWCDYCESSIEGEAYEVSRWGRERGDMKTVVMLCAYHYETFIGHDLR
jgi:hypothetical protein